MRPVVAAICVVAVAACRQETGDQPRPPATPIDGPNIVLIVTDDLRADYLGCTGHPFIKTPHIDRLAREGALFENAFAITPICCSSRAAILTGLYTHINGATHNRTDIDYDQATLVSDRLKAVGYKAASIGKWHLGLGEAPLASFDYCIGLGRQDDPQGMHKAHYYDGMLKVDGKTIQTTGYNTDVLSEFAADWIRKEAGDQPFFLLFATKSPHLPLVPPQRHETLYANEAIEAPASYNDPISRLPRQIAAALQRRGARTTYPAVQEELERLRKRGEPAVEFIREYARMIPSVDEAVGRIYEALERTGELDNTILIFTSDNGLLLGEHGIYQKEVAYEPSIHIPLIIRYPAKLPRGQHAGGLARNVDIAPTILDLVGLPTPDALHGRSLGQLINRDGDDWREAVLLMAPYFPGQRPVYLGVRTRRYKYVRYVSRALEVELFDLQEDPEERHNLALKAGAAEVLGDMHRLLFALMSQHDVPKYWLEPLGGIR